MGLRTSDGLRSQLSLVAVTLKIFETFTLFVAVSMRLFSTNLSTIVVRLVFTNPNHVLSSTRYEIEQNSRRS